MLREDKTYFTPFKAGGGAQVVFTLPEGRGGGGATSTSTPVGGGSSPTPSPSASRAGAPSVSCGRKTRSS